MQIDDPKEPLNGEGPDEIQDDAVVEGEQDGDEDTSEDSPDGDESEGDEGSVDEVAARPSRGQQRTQRLANERRELRERLERQDREIAELKTARQAPRQEQEREPTADEMALWTPEQRMDYRLGKAEKASQQQIQTIQFNSMEAADKAEFRALQAEDPLAKKYAGEVETRLADLRRQGQNVSRERLLTYIIGEKARQSGRKAVNTQQKQGAARIASQTTRPARASGDVPAGDRTAARLGTLEKRLAGVEI